MQKAVGGYIEIVPTPDGRLIELDEEGKIKGKGLNKKANDIYDSIFDHIVGDVILANNDEID
jgi:hypothetical protein